MTEELKPLPCPFCGDTENIFKAVDSPNIYLVCGNCHVLGPRGFSSHRDCAQMAKAAKAGDQETVNRLALEWDQEDNIKALRLWNQRASCEDKEGETG